MFTFPDPGGPSGLLTRLLRDRAGNTLAMIAAALVPLLALVGGGIDMGRSYLSQTRLQQACDAGVLAARKKLGSAVAADGVVPDSVAETGNRFFNLNFGEGSYGTIERRFAMTLENDYAISGAAEVKVPTTIMAIFGYRNVDIAVSCAAKLNFSNTDIMFVLDTTGSMASTNPGDSASRIAGLRSVVKNFHAQVEGSKAAGTRVRYGFVPYSTNVNVGGLLKASWMVDSWNYEGRVLVNTGRTTTQPVYTQSWTYVSGSETIGSSYLAASCPADTRTWLENRRWVEPDGTEKTDYTVNGSSFDCVRTDSTSIKVTPRIFDQYRYIYSYKNEGWKTVPVKTWRYKSIPVDVSGLKNNGTDRMRVGAKLTLQNTGNTPSAPRNFDTFFRGCIEERDTYPIDDYDAVDFTRALDLDIDRAPTPGQRATQWRPMLNELSWIRAKDNNGAGLFQPVSADYAADYLNANGAGLSACPAAAKKLTPMSASEIATYVDGLFPEGSTYHDIGMIWGARLISPTGLFAAENADLSGQPTSRHIIYLTDGETAPLDLSYGTYGVEPLSQRRWSPSSPFTLTQTVENRFNVACQEARKRNITIWVVSFGVSLNPVLTACAGPDRAFEAADTADLQDVFSKIAAQLGDLRVTR